MKKTLLLLSILLLMACVSPMRSDFERHQKKWQEANITHYRFELNMICFCTFRNRMPLQIEVLNGQIAAMTDNTGKTITAADAHYDFFARYATIDRLFSELQASLNGKADQIAVAYHPSYGFPTRINIDRIKRATDDELGLAVSAFERLP
ncbi:DUF6174 domain-containing protein [Nitrosomonas sp. Is24]|uniref:DUF6174 domain-containing protein n=1 Tax=Nitrosomonas sp. Is24 TaxID=3080533 RepID=UPI00294B8DED|nr:DUF6174 domain-containing protein [Nitrosomonas sp. Is24]MDV6342042.1 DUF6174 domain-containing protein [Nitrosomonas sp. Is24]